MVHHVRRMSPLQRFDPNGVCRPLDSAYEPTSRAAVSRRVPPCRPMSSERVPLDIGRAAAPFGTPCRLVASEPRWRLTGSLGGITFLQDLLCGTVVQVFDGGVLTRRRRASGGLGCESSREERRARDCGEALRGSEQHLGRQSWHSTLARDERVASSLDRDLGAATRPPRVRLARSNSIRRQL